MADILAQADAAREHGLMLAREKLCHLFVWALDAGDLGTVAAIWKQAEADSVLEEMLIGIDDALYDEMLKEQEGSPGSAG